MKTLPCMKEQFNLMLIPAFGWWYWIGSGLGGTGLKGANGFGSKAPGVEGSVWARSVEAEAVLCAGS